MIVVEYCALKGTCETVGRDASSLAHPKNGKARPCMPIQPDVYDVEFDHVSKRFGDVTAVDDVQVRIRKGEFFSLLGPSGCGKTTTLRMIAGFEQPSEGEIYLNGTPVSGIPPYKRNVNMVFPELRSVPSSEYLGQRRLWPETQEGTRTRAQGPG